MNTTKIYFASDFHLGAPNYEASKKRELRIIKWLTEIQKDATELFLMGDVFDFWFEYKHVIPKGHTRIFGKLAEISDSGIPIHFFPGNHDMWVGDYFEKELGFKIYREPQVITRNEKSFYLAHGDGLGPGDYNYKILKKVFASSICKWFFSWTHPNIGMWIANTWSLRSRASQDTEETFLGSENEWLMAHSEEISAENPHDFFVYGHRHLPIFEKLSKGNLYINLGEWINFDTYGVFDGEQFQLKEYKG
ncbi:MAG: UDP-2,3-diacylglucosamine hydrolase [Sphingobacteriales bacterium]|jgi:UDP-2,3-diacylglucosamine hydrolase